MAPPSPRAEAITVLTDAVTKYLEAVQNFENIIAEFARFGNLLNNGLFYYPGGGMNLCSIGSSGRLWRLGF